MNSVIQSGLTLIPATASPVLKTKIEIAIDSSFPYELAREDFSVNVTQLSNIRVTISDNLVKQLNVVAVNDEEKKITVMFGGAYSGEY
jgi:hypothetical protein